MVMFWSFITSFVAISIIVLIANFASHGSLNLIIAPFGASVVLLAAIPEAPFSRPRNAIGGQLISAFIGVAINAIFAVWLGVDGTKAINGELFIPIGMTGYG